MSGPATQNTASKGLGAGRSFAPSSSIPLLRLTVSAILMLIAVVSTGCSVEQRQLVQPDFCEVHADCENAHVCYESRCAPDQDLDYLPDFMDICPTDPTNDHDRDGLCDDVSACLQLGFDFDQDGVCQRVDNCPHVANVDQADSDGDGHGDLCDPCPNDFPDDTDGDGICDSADSCPGGDCALGGACSHIHDCARGVCSEGICAPLSMVRVDVAEQVALWASVSNLSVADLSRIGLGPGEGQDDAGFVSGLSWYQALWLANRISDQLGMTPCYRLDQCEGEPETLCTSPMCGSNFECEHVGEVDDCTGLALPSLDEWLLVSSTFGSAGAGDTSVASNPADCLDLSLVGGPQCGRVGASHLAPTSPVAGPLSDWVWHEHRMRFGRTRRLAMGANWRAPAVAFERLDSWAYRPQHQADYIGVRYVWRGGPE